MSFFYEIVFKLVHRNIQIIYYPKTQPSSKNFHICPKFLQHYFEPNVVATRNSFGLQDEKE
jgi:hypothetical protein